jgi:hypothetical protein
MHALFYSSAQGTGPGSGEEAAAAGGLREEWRIENQLPCLFVERRNAKWNGENIGIEVSEK